MTTEQELKVYDQLMQVRKCIDALKDVSENIPEDGKYVSVLSIITERLDLDFNDLMPLALGAFRNKNDD